MVSPLFYRKIFFFVFLFFSDDRQPVFLFLKIINVKRRKREQRYFFHKATDRIWIWIGSDVSVCFFFSVKLARAEREREIPEERSVFLSLQTICACGEMMRKRFERVEFFFLMFFFSFFFFLSFKPPRECLVLLLLDFFFSFFLTSSSSVFCFASIKKVKSREEEERTHA